MSDAVRKSARATKRPVRFDDYVCDFPTEEGSKMESQQPGSPPEENGDRHGGVSESPPGADGKLSVEVPDAGHKKVSAEEKEVPVTAEAWLELERGPLVQRLHEYAKEVRSLLDNRGSRTKMVRLVDRMKKTYDEINSVVHRVVRSSQNVEQMKSLVDWVHGARDFVEKIEDYVEDQVEERENEAPSVAASEASDRSKRPVMSQATPKGRVESQDPTDREGFDREESEEDWNDAASNQSVQSTQSQLAKVKAEVASLKAQQEKRRYEDQLRIQEAQQRLLVAKAEDDAARAKLEADLLSQVEERGRVTNAVPIGNPVGTQSKAKSGMVPVSPASERQLIHDSWVQQVQSRDFKSARLATQAPLVENPHLGGNEMSERQPAVTPVVKMNPIEELVQSIEDSRPLPRPQLASTPAGRDVSTPTDNKEIQQFFQGLAKPHLPKFDGNRDRFEDWRAQFEVFVDQSKVPVKFKMIMLKNSLSGHPYKLVSNLGFTEAQYKMAMFKLDQRYGGETRTAKKYLDHLLQWKEVAEGDLKGIEDLANQLCDVVSKLEGTDHAQELIGNTILYTLVKQKVPQSLLVKYAEQRKPDSQDGLAVFTRWFNRQVCLMLEMSEIRLPKSKVRTELNGKKKSERSDKSATYAASAVDVGAKNTQQKSDVKKKEEKKFEGECQLCKGSHHIVRCQLWKPASVDERWKIAKEKALCYKCLCAKHMAKNCKKEPRKCEIDGCQRTHHRHLHKKEAKDGPPTDHVGGFGISEDGSVRPSRVSLRVLPVLVADCRGVMRRLNAFLDDGCDSTYVRRSVLSELGISQIEDHDITMSTMAGNGINVKSGTVALTVESLDGNIRVRLGCRILDHLCDGLRPQNWSDKKGRWSHLAGIEFPRIDGSKTVDIVIGSDHPELTMSLEEVLGQPGEPVARLTPLGWTCTGMVEMLQSQDDGSYYTIACYSSADSRVDDSLRALWNMDLLTEGCDVVFTPEEQKILERVEATKVYHKEEGRYEVSIPWIDGAPDLPCNYETARRRLISLEHTLLKKPRLAEKYREGMQQNIEKGYLRRVPDADITTGWYLPHFPVVREDKETTKVRIVFDSASKHLGVCLNDRMHAGPKLQKEIFDILVRFRLGQVGLAGDIKEMFSQVLLSKRDRDYHRILWRDLNVSGSIEVYESTRLTFGDKASPFLAMHVLQSHARDHREESPSAADVCLESTYMDDAITSIDGTAEATQLRKDLAAMLIKAGYHIRRWCSNDPMVLDGVAAEDRAVGILEVNDSSLPSIKTLGIRWDADPDCFGFAAQKIVAPETVTKRTLLSRVATLFDPLQWLAPFSIRIKMTLQQSWVLGLGWDEPMPEDLTSAAAGWFEELPKIEEVVIPRCYFSMAPVGGAITIHTFSDASCKAYAAVCYVRLAPVGQRVQLALIAAKARVAPLKAVSIPRLELMAAVLGFRLTLKITKLLRRPMSEATFWTDSMDVVHWVRNQSRLFKPFVANRISFIQTESNPQQWRFVPGKENPADVATRGMSAEELKSANVWFQGPEFLHSEESHWPVTIMTQIGPTDEASVESSKSAVRSNASVVVPTSDILDRLNYRKFTTWNRLVRVMAWVLRFVRSVRPKNSSIPLGDVPAGVLSREEFRAAERNIIKTVQQKCLVEQYNALVVGDSRTVLKGSLKNLAPFLDSDGLMRVGGRLQHADLPYDVRHPVILPSADHVSILIIRQSHLVAGHSRGVNAILAETRQRFWIVNGREAVKRIAYGCYQCRKMRAKLATQVMAPLPASRVTMSLRAFSYCGIDFAGPFITKITRFTSAKRYLCLFTCLQTRGVHLEMAYSLETDGFLLAFSRMVSRRGKPVEVVTDNGSNFIGADRCLRELVDSLDRTQIANSATNQGIAWKFNPPYGSHHGGVFEALIKSAKKSLYAIFGEARLTDEELLTAIVEVEGLLNSRPLTYCSSDPQDLEVLTPNHFLVGQCGGQLAPQIVEGACYNPRHRWRVVQDMLHRFWSRWQKEYLTLQQQRGKWRETHPEVGVNDVVVLQEQGCPRRSWPIGRVTEVEKGSDGHVRTVTVISKGRTYRRPITRLVPLVVDGAESVKTRDRTTQSGDTSTVAE